MRDSTYFIRTIRLCKAQSKVLVPQLLVSRGGFKLVSAIKVL
jgi:hypothetical protein